MVDPRFLDADISVLSIGKPCPIYSNGDDNENFAREVIDSNSFLDTRSDLFTCDDHGEAGVDLCTWLQKSSMDPLFQFENPGPLWEHAFSKTVHVFFRGELVDFMLQNLDCSDGRSKVAKNPTWKCELAESTTIHSDSESA